MHRKFRISVDGRPYDVVVEELAGEIGAPQPVAAPVASAAVASAAAVAAAPAPTASKPAAAAGDEVAPLAGVVDSVDVTVGQSVAVGTKIATIEAMKMKTEVFAKGAGTVATIVAKPGEAIDSGGVILTLA